MKRFAKVCTFLMVLVTAFSLCTTAYAAGSVTYENRANEFIFAPGTTHSPTSLFENFQNVMPGDTLTEQILIKNTGRHDHILINVYMRSLGAQENTDDFLSQMKLTVKGKGDSPLYEAPANETAQLTDWVFLGTVKHGGKITLDLTLEVPITRGNDYQNQIGYIDWEFKVEEIPMTTPATGDSGAIFLYAGLMVISLAALIVLLLCRKRKRK